MDLVSIIVPVYNTEAYLPDCLDSIVNQTYKDIEIILVDDGSTDNSGRICDEYAKQDNRIVVIHKENGGVSSARNRGIDISNGKFICFIDSDDTIDKLYVETLAVAINDDEVDLVLCNVRDIWINRISEKRKIKEYLSGDFFADYYKLINLLRFPVLKLYKSQIIKKYNLKFYEDIVCAEDQIFNFEYYIHISKYVYIDKAYYNYYHRNNGSLSTIKSREAYSSEFRKLQIEREFLYKNNILKRSKLLNNHAIACIKRFITIENEEKTYLNYKKRIKQVILLMDFKEITIKNYFDNNFRDYSFKRMSLLLLLKYRLIFLVYLYFSKK